MNKKRLITLIISLAAVMALVFPAMASVTPTDSTGAAQEGEPLKIGLLTDQTSALAFYGLEQQHGFELGLDYATGGSMEVAGRPIEVFVRDNGGDADTATEQARQLIEEEGVEVLFGTVASGVTLNLQATAQEYEMILMAGPAATPAITGANFNEYTFRVCRNTWQDAFTLASYAVETFGPNYVILAADAAFGIDSAAAFDAALAEVDGTPVRDTLLVPYETTDFTAPLTEVLDSGADFVIFVWAGSGGITLVNQARDLGVFDEMGFVQGTDTNYHLALGNLAIEDVAAYIVYHYTLPDNEVNDWMVEQSMARYEMPSAIVDLVYPDTAPEDVPGEVPGLFTECGFATAQALVAALEETGGDTSPEAMIAALEGLSFEGPKGTYTIRPEDHQALVPMYIIALKSPDEMDPNLPFDYFNLIEEVPAEETLTLCNAPAERSSDSVTCTGQASE